VINLSSPLTWSTGTQHKVICYNGLPFTPSCFMSIDHLQTTIKANPKSILSDTERLKSVPFVSDHHFFQVKGSPSLPSSFNSQISSSGYRSSSNPTH
jgi:hypothetical protein